MSRSPASKSFTDPRGVADAIVGVVLFAAACAIGSQYVAFVVRAGGKPRFYQEQFAPAVMLACGYGYVNVASERAPALDRFLRVESDTYACADDLTRVERRPLTSMQRAFRYLMTTVATTWRVRGRVAWSALAPLYGLFYGASIVLAYAVFRQGMGRLLSAILAGALSVSTLHMIYLAHLRDYAKMPFVLAIVLLAMRAVSPRATPRGLIAVAVVAGLVTGIGVGFRNDLLVLVPAFVAVLVLFVAFPLRGYVGLRGAAVGAYVVAFMLALSPMASIYRTGGGNSSQHLMLLGLGQPFSQELGIDNGDLYEWGYDYKDELAHAMISSYADRRLGDHRFLIMYGPEYDRTASRYLADIAENFPADMLIRVYASTLRILELPYNATSVQPPTFVQRWWILKAYGARTRLLRTLGTVWPWTIAVTLVALTIWRLRVGLFAVLLVLYLGGYPALQFNERHYFHLEWIGWWTLGFTLSLIAAAAAAAFRSDRRRLWLEAVRPEIGWSRGIGFAAAAWLAIAIVVLAPLAALRTFQERHVRGLLRSYLDAAEEPLPLTTTPLDHDRVRFDGVSTSAAVAASRESDAVHAEYIVADFGGPACDTLKMDVTYRYAATEPQHDFTRTIQVQPPLSARPVRVFFSGYYHRPHPDLPVQAGYGLVGLDVPASAANCVARLARVRDTRSLPILMGLRLPPGWEDATLYGTIAGLEARRDAEQAPEVYTWPVDLPVRRSTIVAPVRPLAAGDIVKRSPTLVTSATEWRVSGAGGVGGRGPFLYLAQLKPQFAPRGSLVMASGRIARGGISFGLVRSGAWVGQVGVTTPGDFVALVRVPADGEYSVVLANNLVGSSLRNEVVITRAGWIG